MAMVETLNNVFITGVLVKKNFEVKDVDVKDDNGNITGQDEAISGSLVLRTNDGSEHEVGFYSRKHKKDGGENALFKAYETIMNDYISLEENPEEANVIRLGASEFGIQDYKSKKDGTLKSFNDIRGKFANRLEGKELELNPQEAKFEVSGIITKMEQEIIKEQPTGNMIINLDVLGYAGKIIPVRLKVLEPLVQPFQSVGFYESGAGKFSGKIINTKTVEEIVEQQAFGEPIKKQVTLTERRYEVTGGSPLGSIYDLKLTDADYDMAKNKRRLKLQEIMNQQQTQQTSVTPTQNQAPTGNPFGGQQGTQSFNPANNPFANK